MRVLGLDPRRLGVLLSLLAVGFGVALMATSIDCSSPVDQGGICVPVVQPVGPVLAFLAFVAAFGSARGAWLLCLVAAVPSFALPWVFDANPWLVVPGAILLGAVCAISYEARFYPGRRLPVGRVIQ